jgi:tRNA (guanosine-2'-O-)-methyltransferase
MEHYQLWNKLKEYLSPERIKAFDCVLSNRTRHFTVAVENLFQSHNASAIMRNCDCFGIQDLHVIANANSYKLSKDVAMGAQKWVDMHHYHQNQNNTQDCIDALKLSGFQIVATSPHMHDKLLPDFDIRTKSAFFFGTERDGLSSTVLEQADLFVRIPMYGFSESYNISVSAALVLHDVITRLKNSKVDWGMSQEEILEKKVDWAVKSIRCGPQLLRQFQVV